MNKSAINKKEIVRKIANVLNEIGYPCCRCLDCKTCKKAEEIYDFILANPPAEIH